MLNLKKKLTLGERFRCLKATLFYRFILWTGIFVLWNKTIRFFRESHYERKIGGMMMRKYDTPQDLEDDMYDRKWNYKPDPLGGRLDYIISPEVAALKMAFPNSYPDAFDCDDQHFYVAYHLAGMKDVEDVLLLYTGWRDAGHATVVYTYKGRKYMYNYGIQEIHRYLDAPHLVILRHAQEMSKQYVVYYAFQTVKTDRTLPQRPFMVGSGLLHDVKPILRTSD